MSERLNLPSGFYQATLRFVGSAIPRGAAVVFGGTAPVGASPSDIGTMIKTATTSGSSAPWSAGNGFSPLISIADVLVKLGPLDIGPAAVYPINAGAGSAAGDAVPPNISLLVSKFTALGGHKGRGRMFIPGLVEGQVQTGGIIVAGSLTSLQNSFNWMLNQMDTNGIDMHLLHRYDPAKGESPRAPSQVTSLVVSSTVATQRHRLRR